MDTARNTYLSTRVQFYILHYTLIYLYAHIAALVVVVIRNARPRSPRVQYAF